VKPALKLHNLDIMGVEGTDMDVSAWTWRKHISRASGREMLSVTYYGGLSDPPVTSYYAICHDGFAGERARKNLADIAHKAGVILDYASADLHDIAKQMTEGTPPKVIEYKREGRFYTVLSHQW
jgi:DNA repair protein RadD